MQGRASGRVRDFALYGETTGETDDLGLPVRCDWAKDYRGRISVVYGHTPVPLPQWLNQTVNIDTGCVFGGKLTALRYPEREFVSVPAARTYSEPARPFLPQELPETPLTAQQVSDDLLDAGDVLGKRIIPTRLRGMVTIREENAAAALEMMSRFAVDPRWLIYLPPTMSPCETSSASGLLEHPDQVFAYYRSQDARSVICQEKHMGSRAVVVICRDEQSSASGSASRPARSAWSSPAPAEGSSATSHSNERFWSASARRWIARVSGRNWTRTGHASTRASALVSESTRASALPVRTRRRSRPGSPSQGSRRAQGVQRAFGG